jgi:hypothetical protein
MYKYTQNVNGQYQCLTYLVESIYSVEMKLGEEKEGCVISSRFLKNEINFKNSNLVSYMLEAVSIHQK